MLIISGIVAVALVVIGFVTLRAKIDRNPEANGSSNKRSNKRAVACLAFQAPA